MVNPKIFGLLVIVIVIGSAIAVTTTSSHYVTAYNPGPAVDEEADVDVEEAVEAENTTMAGTANQGTTNRNMTVTNSTN